MTSEQKLFRSKRIKWTIKILSECDFEMQTIQLIFYLIDCLTIQSILADVKMEVLVVTSIYFIIKFQGDFSSKLNLFNEFVREKLKIEKTTLLKIEMRLVSSIPNDFIYFMTFSDYLFFNFEILKQEKFEFLDFVHRICKQCVGFYLFSASDFNFEELIMCSIITVVEQTDLSSRILCPEQLDKINSYKKNDTAFLTKLSNFLINDNRYVQMIFNRT